MEIVTITGSVKQIDEGAFYGSSLLRSVYFENGLKSIDNKAFYGCNLKLCNLSTSCETIGGSAFYNNPELARLTLGNVNTIGNQAFYYAGITDVKLPNTLKILGDYAFYNCKSLENVDFGNSVESIGYECFWNCSKIKKIVLPDSVLTVGKYAFDTITDLEEITFGKNITYMPGYVIFSCPNIKTLYYNCLNCQHGEFSINEKLQYRNAAPMLSSASRVNKVVVGNGVTKIPGSAFFQSHIEEVVLSNSVTEICDSAFMKSYVKNINLDNIKTVGVFGFAYCHNLQNVNLNSIEVIKAKAFYYCDDFTSLTLPECLVELNAASFSGCDSIETLYYNAKHCEGHFEGSFWGDTQSYTYYPFQWWDRQTGSAMRANIADIRIGNTVEYLCSDLFRHNGDEEITIPSSVTYITPSSGAQDGTFCNCPDVKRLIVKKPEGSIEGAPWSNTGTITVIWDPE